MNTCAGCKFFKPFSEPEQPGSCTRFPPFAGALIVGTIQTVRGNQPQITNYAAWPRVAEHESCGEWQGENKLLLSN